MANINYLKIAIGGMAVILLIILTLFVSAKFNSCNKPGVITGVPGYDSTFHKQTDERLKKIESHYDSTDRVHNQKFQTYDSTLMNNDFRQEINTQIYNQIRKFNKALTPSEKLNLSKERLKDG
jgi:hypothetical protein